MISDQIEEILRIIRSVNNHIWDAFFRFFDLIRYIIDFYKLTITKYKDKEFKIFLVGLITILMFNIFNFTNIASIINVTTKIQIVFFSVLALHSLIIIICAACKSITLSILVIMVGNWMTICGVELIINAWGSTSFTFVTYSIVYCFMWVCYSLIADIEIAKMANEIIAGLFILIFTFSDYFTGIISDNDLLNFAYQNFDANHKEIRLVFDMVHSEGVEVSQLFQILSGLPLPLIGLSSFSIIIISIKQYWIKKYGKDILFREEIKQK